MSRLLGRVGKPAALVSMGVILPSLIVFCGRMPTESARTLMIATPHPLHAGVIIWNPNDYPLLSLSATGDLPGPVLDSLIWHQRGWQVDDSAWRGRDLRVNINTPGCGYGGTTFEITVTTPDRRYERVIQVQMLPYVCAGAP